MRNALVHHSGEASLVTGEQLSNLRKIPGIAVETSELGIGVSFVDDAAKAVQDVMEFLHAKINELIDRTLKPKAVR
ncbi:hypothetical protein D3C84_724530 [compost metagenome]